MVMGFHQGLPKHGMNFELDPVGNHVGRKLKHGE
jgi:hypothetical protein